MCNTHTVNQLSCINKHYRFACEKFVVLTEFWTPASFSAVRIDIVVVNYQLTSPPTVGYFCTIKELLFIYCVALGAKCYTKTQKQLLQVINVTNITTNMCLV